MNIPVAVMFTGGKDSTYALHWAILHSFDVRVLVSIKPKRENSWMFHYPSVEITNLQALALDMPHELHYVSGIKDKEIEELKNILLEVRKNYNVRGIVTGALLSDYQRMNFNLVCEELGLKVYSPLWRKKQDKYLIELIESGFKIILTAIYAMGIPLRLLGKVLDRDDALEIIRLSKKFGFNPAFEGGEAETLVIDAPLFKKRIEILKYDVKKEGPYSYRLILKDVRLIDK